MFRLQCTMPRQTPHRELTLSFLCAFGERMAVKHLTAPSFLHVLKQNLSSNRGGSVATLPPPSFTSRRLCQQTLLDIIIDESEGLAEQWRIGQRRGEYTDIIPLLEDLKSWPKIHIEDPTHLQHFKFIDGF